MQIQTRNISGIHCKVSCNDQFRRFVFNGTNFSSLVKQIQQILVLEKEFVLKYKDNEGDQITISSDEELSCALSFSSGNVFRLIVVPRGTSQMFPAPMQTAPTTPPIQTTPTIPPMQTAPTTPPMQTTPTIPPMQTAPTTSPDERQCGGRRGGRGEGDTKKEVEEVEGEEGDTKKEVEVELVECVAKISKTVVMKENATSVRKSSRRKTRK